MAVINGHAYAGGLQLALSHDFRIMQDAPYRKVCLNELALGSPLTSGSNALMCGTLPIQTLRKMVWAETSTP